MQQPETKFKKIVLCDLKRLKNRWYFKSQEVCIKGIPDIIMCLNGFFVSIELKKDEEAKIEELQWYNAEQIICRGRGLALIVWPELWEGVYEFLKRIDAGEDPRREPPRLRKSGKLVP